MAEEVVNFVVGHLLKTTTANIVWMIGLRKELDILSSEFAAIKHVLQDAETRRINEQSVRSWLLKLKYVAYDLDDLLEEWRTLEPHAGAAPESCYSFGYQVRDFLSTLMFLLRHPNYSCNFHARVDEIKERLEQIRREKSKYQFVDHFVRKMREERRTTSWMDQSSVIGRDDDKKTLINKLLEDESFHHKVSTLFILGMGGLGKTTLAKAIYNDGRVQNHFSGNCMWVCVGEVFDREIILKSMIESWGESTVQKRVVSMHEQVAKIIENRRYLLVLDDVWNEDYLKWKPLQEVLNKGAKGSRVMITTRNRGVERAIISAYTHQLEGLSDDECLSIFKNIVFEKDEPQDYEHLMDIGERIVEKCGGLPLAVKTIASVIRGREPTKEQWENILNNRMWDLSEYDTGILPALMLSYAELTPQLKNCFSYCSIFDKDSILKKDQLIKLWISQGFITAGWGIEEEEVGEDCFHKLLDRSLLQEATRDEEGTIISCKMHDHVHDLAQLVSKEECQIIGSEELDNNATLALVNARHCRVKEEVEWRKDTKVVGAENLRTFYFSGISHVKPSKIIKLLRRVRVLYLQLEDFDFDMNYDSHFGKLLHLRYLVLQGESVTKLPASLKNFKDLRYLDLRDLNISALPKSIRFLTNLRTLDLHQCRNLKKLPDSIPTSLRQLYVPGCVVLRELPGTIMSLGNLRVIDLTDCLRMTELPEGISALPGLRRLSIEGCDELRKLPYGEGKWISGSLVVAHDRFIVRTSAGCSNISELGRPNMVCPRGMLQVYKLEEVRSKDEVRAARLEEKTSLKRVSLSWGNDQEVQKMKAEAQGVLEALHTPPQLRSLEIYRYPGLEFPGWIGDAGFLGSLQQLTLDNCYYCSELPQLGLLPCLKTLQIEGLQGVKRVGSEFLGRSPSTFPFCRLESLYFRRMENWSEWVTCTTSNEDEGRELQPMPMLQDLDIIDCPKLKALPPFIFSPSLPLWRHFGGLGLEKSTPLLQSFHFLPIHNTNLSCIHLIGKQAQYQPLLGEWFRFFMGPDMWEFPSGLLGNTVMQKLGISGFSHLGYLPEELSQLKNLQLLVIQDCPLLSMDGRCEIGGEFWPRIAHIPCVHVDGRNIQGEFDINEL